jgi:IS4 transposase
LLRNRKCRGNSIDIVGKKLQDVLPLLKREILDVIVEVKVKRRKYKGKSKKMTRTFRLVCVFNEETEKYHIYLTNIPTDTLIGEDIAALYSARWEVELIFKELKNIYHIDEIPSANPYVVKCLIWSSILTIICSRRILRLVKTINPKNAHRYTHLRWAKVFIENAYRLLSEILESMGYKIDKVPLFDIMIKHGLDPNVKRERLMDAWIA